MHSSLFCQAYCLILGINAESKLLRSNFCLSPSISDSLWKRPPHYGRRMRRALAIKSALSSLMINQAPKSAILGRLSYLAFSTTRKGSSLSDRNDLEILDWFEWKCSSFSLINLAFIYDSAISTGRFPRVTDVTFENCTSTNTNAN